MGKQTKGVKKQRPGDKAGMACEAPGCERTECSRWLAAGRCCTGLKCQEHFNVGKGKAVAMEKAAEQLNLKRKREAAAKPSCGPLKVGETLIELPPWAGAYFDEVGDQEWTDLFREHGTLATSLPFTVTNVRRDEQGDQLDFSFLVFGTFRRAEHVEVVETRWVSLGIEDNGATGFEAVPTALDFMELVGAHEQDIAELSTRFDSWVDDQWSKVRSEKGSVFYRNSYLRESTWDEPVRYWDPDRDCEWDRDRGCEIPLIEDW